MKLLALDISGNFHEGKGTTGICYMEDGEPKFLTQIHAGGYNTVEEYWAEHEDYIQKIWPDHIVLEGYKLYNHKGKEAKIQANSNLETPQLLGFLKMVCYRWEIPYTIQYAADVKTRWSEEVLVRLGVLTEKKTGRGTSHYWNGQLLISHHKDALKHALHWWRYKKEKL